MRSIAVLICCLLASGLAWADNDPLSEVATQLSLITESTTPPADVDEEGLSVTLSYNTRKYMVHNTDKLGRHSEKVHETVGPKNDGLIVKVTLQGGRYAGAAKIPQTLTRPYWYTFVNAYPIAKGKQHLHVNISYGSKTDRETIKKIKKMLDSMIDDALDNAERESGAHNKALDGPSQ